MDDKEKIKNKSNCVVLQIPPPPTIPQNPKRSAFSLNNPVACLERLFISSKMYVVEGCMLRLQWRENTPWDKDEKLLGKTVVLGLEKTGFFGCIYDDSYT